MKTVTGDGLAHDQARNAIKAVFGADREVTKIEEEASWLGKDFPQDATWFHVESESAACTHGPRCVWYDHIFHRRNRCVVLSMFEMISTPLATVIRELTKSE